ncbi:MAG TPA: SDR family oxidoreductase [Spirochaetia bacterium]|nr:SDR family oxidoreductase [Spirochaetia bacterium]
MAAKNVVAISGASGLLGPAVARAFRETGAALAVCGRSPDKLTQLLDSVGAPTDERLESAVDLTDLRSAQSWAEDIRRRFGKVDAVINLVGGYKGGVPVSEVPPSDWQELESALVGTTLNVIRAFAGMLKESRGRFLGVTSVKVQAPTSKSAVYAAAKAASDAFVLALADELRGTGATANLIVVDSIESPDKPYGRSTPAREIADTMVFLCSASAATINGARIPLIGRGL